MQEVETRIPCPSCGKRNLWARYNGYRFGEIEYFVYCKNARIGDCSYEPEYMVFREGGLNDR